MPLLRRDRHAHYVTSTQGHGRPTQRRRCRRKGAPNRVHFFATSSSNDHPFTPTPPCIYFPRPPSPTISLEYLYYHIIWVVLPGAARERSAIVRALPGRASAAPKKRVRQGLAGNLPARRCYRITGVGRRQRRPYNLNLAYTSYRRHDLGESRSVKTSMFGIQGAGGRRPSVAWIAGYSATRAEPIRRDSQRANGSER